MNAKLIKRILVAGLALVGLMAGQAVYAQTTSAAVTVTATVSKACRFYSGGAPTLTIANSGGVIDPVLTGTATGTATLDYKCQSGVNPLFEIDQTSLYESPKNRTVNLVGGVTAANLAASITVTATGGAGTGLGAGQEKTATIRGDILDTDYQAAPPDTYTKSVTIYIQAQ